MKKFVLDFVEGIRVTGCTYQEVPERIRKTLHEAKTIWFNEKEPDRVTVEFDAEVAHFFERRLFFPRQEIVEKRGNGNLVLSFDVHNEMDLREQLARWMPAFSVLAPVEYREAFCDILCRARARNSSMVKQEA